MKKYYREIRKNIFKVFYKPESGDYAVAISVALVIGLIINLISKGGF